MLDGLARMKPHAFSEFNEKSKFTTKTDPIVKEHSVTGRKN